MRSHSNDARCCGWWRWWRKPYSVPTVVAHNIGIAIYEAKITSIEDRLKGYSKPLLLGIEPPIPPYKQSLMTALAGDQTTDTSGQVINLNMNTAFKCVPHILESLQFLRTVVVFWSLFQFPMGKQSFLYVSGETRTYTLSHHGRTISSTYITIEMQTNENQWTRNERRKNLAPS